MPDMNDHELLDALGVDAKSKKKAKRTSREERIITGFEEIQRFVDEQGHQPRHGEDKDIFERLYAVRLEQIRKQSECVELVKEMDHQGLLDDDNRIAEPPAEYSSDEELLSELGVKSDDEDITRLKHVKSRAEKNAAEEIASRTPCEDFNDFKPQFEQVQQDLQTGLREAKLLTQNPKVNEGDWFVLNGQKVFVAKVSDDRSHGFDGNDYRLRVIYDNGTESDLLMRSLQRALDKDEAGRRIVELGAGPLFADVADEDDLASGTIYVLRSKSEHPDVVSNRDVLHKIGVTGGSVEKRIANAVNDATFLLADVEVVRSYDLYNINRVKLENLIHRFFEPARLDIEIKDRFGKPVTPREWFLIPLFVIDEVVEKIKNGTLSEYIYDVEGAGLRHLSADQGKGQ